MQRIFLIAFFVVFFPALAVATTSIGVINLDEDTAAVADMLTLKLSQQPGLITLERDQIRLILQEQQLSASGLTSTRDSLIAGKLLDADALVFLDKIATDKEKFITIRMVSVKHAAILEEFLLGFPEKDIGSYCDSVIRELAEGIDKLKKSANRLRAVSIVGFRNVMPTEGVALETYLDLLLRYKLQSNSNVVVVEREQLDDLSYEKILAKRATVEFLKGALLVDGSIEENPLTNDFILNLRIRAPDESKTFEFSGDRKDLTKILENINSAIAECASLGGDQSWNPKDEAREFTMKAEGHLRAGLYEKALALSNAAWALGARDWKTVEVRTNALIYNFIPQLGPIGYGHLGHMVINGKNSPKFMSILALWETFPELHNYQFTYALELLDLAEKYFLDTSFPIESFRRVFVSSSFLLYVATAPQQKGDVDYDTIRLLQEKLKRMYLVLQVHPFAFGYRHITELSGYSYFWGSSPEDSIDFVEKLFAENPSLDRDRLRKPRTRDAIRLQIYRNTLIDFYIPPLDSKTLDSKIFPFPRQASSENKDLSSFWLSNLERWSHQDNLLLSLTANFAIGMNFPDKRISSYESALKYILEYLIEDNDDPQKGNTVDKMMLQEFITMISDALSEKNLASIDKEEVGCLHELLYAIITHVFTANLEVVDLTSFGKFLPFFSEQQLIQLRKVLTEIPLKDRNVDYFQNSIGTLLGDNKHTPEPIQTINLTRLPVNLGSLALPKGRFAQGKYWLFDFKTILSVNPDSLDIDKITVPPGLFPKEERNGIKLAIGNDYLLLSRANAGFATYSLSSKEWRHYQEKTNIISSCFWGDKFYMGYESSSSGILEFDPQTESVRILCSSIRSPAQTPLDDINKYSVRHIIPYDKQHILISASLIGTWKLNIKELQFEQLSPDRFFASIAPDGFFIYQNKIFEESVRKRGRRERAYWVFWDNLGYYIKPSVLGTASSSFIDQKPSSPDAWLLPKPFPHSTRVFDGNNIWLLPDSNSKEILAFTPGARNPINFTLVSRKNPSGPLSHKRSFYDRRTDFFWTPLGLTFVTYGGEIWVAGVEELKEKIKNADNHNLVQKRDDITVLSADPPLRSRAKLGSLTGGDVEHRTNTSLPVEVTKKIKRTPRRNRGQGDEPLTISHARPPLRPRIKLGQLSRLERGRQKNASFPGKERNTYTSIEEALANPDNAYALELSRKDYTKLPREIFSISNLRTLNLRDMNVVKIPPEIANLQFLRMLTLFNMQLSSLPSEIGKLKDLESLNLGKNNLNAIPPEIGMLQDLSELIVNRNNIAVLPQELFLLSNLRSLWASDNKLTAIPKEISNLQNLHSLDLSNNQISYVPAEIENLVSLQSLDLSNNNISFLPSGIANLNMLHQLNLKGTLLSQTDINSIAKSLPNCEVVY